MARPKRVLCITDMAGVGRSSMAVVLPVLSACGVQACPLPTMLYSSHHGGFREVREMKTESYANSALSHYRQEKVSFDAIYVGYLTSKEQFSLAWRAFRIYYNSLKIVDPVLGDNYKTYSKVNDEISDMMKGLCCQADLITPNYTESALLLGENPAPKPLSDHELRERLEMLSSLSSIKSKKSSVVITSCPNAAGGYEVAGCGKGGSNPFKAPLMYVPESYPGTGDAFTSALIGLMLQGKSLEDAVQQASRFVESAVRLTYENNGEIRQGVWFEGCLSMLAPGNAPKSLPNLGAFPF